MYRNSPQWGYDDVGTWLSCNASWSVLPGDYNCDNTVEKQWFDSTDDLGHGSVIYHNSSEDCDLFSTASRSCASDQVAIDSDGDASPPYLGRCFDNSVCNGQPLTKGTYTVKCH